MLCNEINYSIIIPHKNLPDLLKRCLKSIPRRDDVQIIVVDDNSDPSIVDFEHFPGVGEKCVEVYFTKEGKGAGYARNVGLEHAKGKWLLFADADDFFTTNIDSLMNKYVNSEHDIIFFNAESRYSDSLEPAQRNIRLNHLILYENVQKLKYQFYPPWCKIIKRELQYKNKIYFSETMAANDVVFSVTSGFFCKSCHVDQTIGYCITYRNGSLENGTASEIILDRIFISLEINKFYKEHSISESCPYYYMQLSNLLIKKDYYNFKNGLHLIQQYGYSSLYTLLLVIYDILFHRIPYKCRLKR